MDGPTRVPPELTALLEAWRGVPAFVRDGHLDVVASNALARAVSSGFTPGVNLVRFTFLNEWTVDAISEWDDTSAQVVAILKGELGARQDDPAFRTLVGELAVRSEQFSSVWADVEATIRAIGTITLDHPLVGPLQLTYQTLGVPDAPDLALVIWTAAPGSAQDALDRLIAIVEAQDISGV